MTSNNEQTRFDDGFTENTVASDGPLKGIAENPAAYDAYLKHLQAVLLQMKRNVETLQTHVRVHARGQRVAGDKWGQARLRALPLELSVSSLISDLETVTKGMEKSAHRHHAHAEKVQDVAKQRKDKALEKERKKNPLPRAVPNKPSQAPQAGQQQNSGYSGPTTLWGLSDRNSA
ncbi:hypothetical protein ACIBL6_47670 [Streptomyces sp. NPDC050400]|uniref:hypothetical protein n=1 Tax=Streptomyces sp. NPDC050400 TaxID=3365610 RepID=UPI0037BE0882